MTQLTQTFVQCIEREEEILAGLCETFGSLRAFERELSGRIGKASFLIGNAMIWDAMLAKRDLLTIHFASWIRGLAQKGGFFGQVRAHYLGELRRAWSSKLKPTGDQERDAIKKMTTDHRRAQLEARFPAAVARGRIDVEDIEALKDAIWDKLAPVVKG